MSYEDILYEKKDGIAVITINRPKVYNAFRGKTVDEMIAAFKDSWHDSAIGAVVLTGTGDKAFCTGGDQKDRGEKGYGDAKTGIGLDMETLHWIIRAVPKPVIAAVNGYAIGGGHVLHVICDLTIASDTAKFGQVGPKVGSFDAGFGSAYLARVVGEKKAREIWYLCRQYTAQEALAMGLVNKVVAPDKLMDEAWAWGREILSKSGTAIQVLKQSFNADTDHIEGIGRMSESALALFVQTPEAHEGLNAFKEKRPPEFSKFRK
ncbi:MAG: 1,4-dihydroxy-2-naphthoyl-CoA synthase [Nitrospirae bacterium]|nr:1,4-dihydroxy-2-naphthoyl-CoA synthase [Nitrospirota bacterium]